MKVIQKAAPALVEITRLIFQLSIVIVKRHAVSRRGKRLPLEPGVALQQHSLVGKQVLQIFTVGLAEDAIYPAAAAFAAAVYQVQVVGCYHYGSPFAYVVGKSLVGYSVGQHFFFAQLPAAGNFLGIFFFPFKRTLHPKAIHPVLYTVRLLVAEVAFCVAQIVYSIQQSRLAAAIGAGNAGHGSIETKPRIGVVAKLNERNIAEQKTGIWAETIAEKQSPFGNERSK